MERLKTVQVKVGDKLWIGSEHPIVVQTMCNTHTSDEQACIAQCLELASAGAEMIRLTVPGLQDVPHLQAIHAALRAAGCDVPIVADIHFSSETAIAAARVVEKVRINPGNFHPDHDKAREQFARFIDVCRENGTAVRIGVNHGSLGKYITERYGNTPKAMALAAMEWVEMCLEKEFYSVVVSLKASNTVVMTQAYRELVALMQARGTVFPLHVGLTEAGNGLSGRIKSCVGIATLLQEGIGDTIRVSLTEPPVAELPVAKYLAEHGGNCLSGPAEKHPEPGAEGVVEGTAPHGTATHSCLSGPAEETATPGCLSEPAEESSRNEILDAAIKWGPKLMRREIDEIPAGAGLDTALTDEIMQAARRRFTKPEYIACPGCGRTMYDLQTAFEQVKARTSHLKGMVIAVMGCIVNGPGEMADADWGYVGEGGGRVSIYRKGQSVLRHVPDSEAIDRLLELIEAES